MSKNLLKKNMSENKKGYTLLFAVLVSALVLAVGISILNISKKEFQLATAARDSSAAFYAADSGIECAIYADFVKDAFRTDTDNSGNFVCNSSSNFALLAQTSYSNGDFYFTAKFGSASCAIIYVSKRPDLVNSAIIHTSIESRGYNTGWNPSSKNCITESAKRVERAIHYSY